MASPSTLPEVPVKHADFISYVASHPDKPLPQLLEPFKQYDAKLREVFAQEPDHPALRDNLLNITPIFDGHEDEVTIRARDLDAESVEEKERYVMPLNLEERRSNGSPAIVKDKKEFQQNFSLFCESSLVDLDWSNVVAAGSSVVTCLLPIPPKFSKSKRALRQYYHETIAPASDVDLFIYGLSEEDAVKKIIEIEQRIKESILTETTTIRTKNAITIASQYPTRHIQIVLRIYKSVAEILTGFDVDCSCAAYDGEQVYAAPRALAAFMTQTNTIDLTRRSPSYESRLSKYSHRGFEVYWPLLDRSRLDPTIYERNFARTVGLARLLVLEKLPTKSERDSYMDERRRERGRPAINRPWNYGSQGNIKDEHEDEVAEWVDAEDVSDYHTFTIPYGPKFHAAKIEKLLYTKDLLLNAEWNKRDDREVNLHRHPAFFGWAKDIIHDCCGFCPIPVTPEEHDVAEEEAKIYVSGEISFIKDDPGRQAIGSFNPITDDDWTEMAYIGNTARLSQAILDDDLDDVQNWLAQEGADPNTRDYTGRTPLHLAVTSSSPRVVQTLIDHGARLVARLADGRTALHLAAARGNVEMVKMILQKSEENEEEEAKKEEIRKQARIAARQKQAEPTDVDKAKVSPETEDNDIEMVDGEDSDEDMRSTTTGSYIKVQDQEKNKKTEDVIPEEDDEDPDVYDVNVLAWDTQCSPLHLAIINGHTEVVKELVQTFGADVLLPIKLLNSYDKSPRGAILTLVLALRLPLEKAKAMTKTLLEIGASSAQGDMRQTTALHYISGEQPEVLETLFKFDEPSARRALNHLAVSGTPWRPSAESPLMSAIVRGNTLAALKLLHTGANSHIEFKDWMRTIESQYDDVKMRDSKRNHDDFLNDIEQPVVLAVQSELPSIVKELLCNGADPNTLSKGTQKGLIDEWYMRYNDMETLLDIVRRKLRDLKSFKDQDPPTEPDYKLEDGMDYFKGINPGSYKEFIAKIQLQRATSSDENAKESYEKYLKEYNERRGVQEKRQAVDGLTKDFEDVEKDLVSRGAKTFGELHPDKVKEKEQSRHSSYDHPKPEPFKITWSFHVHDLTDETREAYLNLFEAAWEGDSATVKALTLAQWGSSGDQMPLKIAVTDANNQSPFSIAVLRGHFDLARAMLEIASAQFYPETEEEKTVYRIGTGMDDEVDSEEDEAMDEVPVYREIIDTKFTIDNVGQVSTQVRSRTSPVVFMNWSCSAWEYNKFCGNNKKYTYGVDNRAIEAAGTSDLVRWAIITDDMRLFAFLLDLTVEWGDRLTNKADDSSAIPSFSTFDFRLAIEYGRIQILAEMIKHGGAGMELESLVNKTGVKYREKPKFYQGLSVHGKKRADWVSAARGTGHRYVTDQSPPLLQAAFEGSLASAEWFMSATPSRHYLDFAEAYRQDKLITHMNTLGGGFEKALSKWLNSRSDLALHCAIMAEPVAETTKLIEYLLKAMPESIDTKSRDGYTPLALAFSLRRYEAAKLLIGAGADQTARDSDGANILHLLLCAAYDCGSRDEKGLLQFLELIDKRLVSSLLVERCSRNPGSLTPLAQWIRGASENDTVLRILLDFGAPYGNEQLELLDGSGETPVHYCVKAYRQTSLKTMLEYRPDLLYRENSVGRTPYELAEDVFITSCVSDVRKVTHDRTRSILDASLASFAPDYEPPEEVNTESIWRVCEKFMKDHPGKRRLVSLLDANEVAKRLAGRHGSRQHVAANDDDQSDASSVVEDTDAYKDEVSEWYRQAPYTIWE